MKLKKLIYPLIAIILLLSSCASSNIDKVLKQGKVLQEDYKTTIPFIYVNGWIVIEVEIENKAYNFILDTGHSNLITTELAAELNSKVLGAEKMSDVNNTQNTTEYTKIDTIKIGNIDFQNTISSIVDLNSNMKSVRCSDIDGLIGSNLMRKAVWDFDFQNQLITIVNSEKQLAIPTETIDSRLYIGAAGVPAVTLEINGEKVLNHTVDFGNGGANLLRTKIFQEQLDANLIKKYVKGSQKASGGFGLTETQTFHHTIIEELKIGNHTVNNIFTRVRNGSANNLGLAFFQNYRVILNWKKKKMKMIEITKAGNDVFKTYGFSTLFEENVRVNAIVETSSASKFLKNGDKILRINDTNYANITENQYCDLVNDDFNNETGPLFITIYRDGKELRFELIKTELL